MLNSPTSVHAPSAAPDWYHQTSSDTLTILSHFPTLQQTTPFTCGPSAILMVLRYYGYTDWDESSLSQAVAANPTSGTSVEHVRDFFQQLGWSVAAHVSCQPRFPNLQLCRDFILSTLQAGHPIIVDWSHMEGHWAVVIGLQRLSPQPDSQQVILADSDDTTDQKCDGYLATDLTHFFAAWYEGPCAGKTQPYQQPFVIAYPPV